MSAIEGHMPTQSALRSRVVVAMSGGVDSSVVAALLVGQGADVVGVSMRLYDSKKTGAGKGCCSPDDLYDARAVASGLGIPFYVVNYQEAFQERVIDRFVSDYRRGRTPSPCVLCNNHVKFDTLLTRALALGAGCLATGHYARIEPDETGRLRLLRGLDRAKDQSYFLFGIEREALGRIRFPLGGLAKQAVRDLAEQFGLPTASKAESQDLCFVGGGKYVDFLEKRLAREDRLPGDIVHSETGLVLGRHAGIHRYTVGQRRGLGVSFGGEPLYVTQISADTGQVTIGPRGALGTSSCDLVDCNWLAFESLDAPVTAAVQIRYRHQPAPAVIEPLDRCSVRVWFDQPESAVSPGQAGVIYRGDEVLGGGWIENPVPA
jgi:tRNA-specific 2-thiouridylase